LRSREEVGGPGCGVVHGAWCFGYSQPRCMGACGYAAGGLLPRMRWIGSAVESRVVQDMWHFSQTWSGCADTCGCTWPDARFEFGGK